MSSKKENFQRLLELEAEPWELHLSDDDLLSKSPALDRLFGAIPFARVLQDLEERGVAEALRRRGYASWFPEQTYLTPLDAQFRLWGKHPLAPEPQLLMDVRTRRGQVRVQGQQFRALVWEWISLQDPMGSFPPGFEPLPGQQHPGLGQFRSLNQLMLDYVPEVDVDALVAVPEFFHNAVLYAGHMQFYDAEREGRFQAMRRDLLPLGLGRASRAVAEGLVEWNGPPEELWTPGEQVRPMAEPIRGHFADPEFQAAVTAARERARYRLLG